MLHMSFSDKNCVSLTLAPHRELQQPSRNYSNTLPCGDSLSEPAGGVKWFKQGIKLSAEVLILW